MATTQAPALAADKVSYEDLYARWEKGNWRATELDFTQDRDDWHNTFGEIERKAALWNYSLFFHGEDSVTDNLSPYIDAAPREEQKYFLATQQVDEARHSVFFARFMREVVDRGDSINGALAATERELTWGFRKTFEHLDKVADSLRRDRSKPNFAAAICMYHVVVEATLAQPGQHFIEGYVRERGIMPGFLEGMENVSKDEQRHIGFGVKCLSELLREDPECKYAVADLLRDVVPYTVGVFKPPNGDRRYTEIFGKTMEEVFEDALK
jgi:ribonucleotide reductase beta subunit family protein with ferritin-like domain